MLMEAIQGNCCRIMAQVAYVRLARGSCPNYGVTLIIDEVQSGFRIGSGAVRASGDH